MERAPFTGGTVLCPNPGVHYNVGMLDYASLYPNVMIGLNVSTESLSVQMTDVGSANFKEMSLSWPDQKSGSKIRCTLMTGDLHTHTHTHTHTILLANSVDMCVHVCVRVYVCACVSPVGVRALSCSLECRL